MAGSSRESNITAAVRAGLLPSDYSVDDPTAGIWYSGSSSGGSSNSARSASNASGVASTVNALSSELSGLFDRIGAISAQNSALSAQYAREQRDWSANQAQIARDYNAAEAAKNRDWQEMMSNTAHQREVADLKAAGLNPILSAMNGNGAAVTSGASASASVPSGDKGDVDTSANASIVGLLSSFLSAQTQLEAANVSARTQEAVAEKYTSMQQLVSEMSNATSRANAELASWTTLSATEKNNLVQQYAAELSSAASRYGANMSYEAATKIARDQLEWQSAHPSNMWQGLGEVLSELSTGRGTISSAIEAAQEKGKSLTQKVKDTLNSTDFLGGIFQGIFK